VEINDVRSAPAHRHNTIPRHGKGPSHKNRPTKHSPLPRRRAGLLERHGSAADRRPARRRATLPPHTSALTQRTGPNSRPAYCHVRSQPQVPMLQRPMRPHANRPSELCSMRIVGPTPSAPSWPVAILPARAGRCSRTCSTRQSQVGILLVRNSSNSRLKPPERRWLSGGQGDSHLSSASFSTQRSSRASASWMLAIRDSPATPRSPPPSCQRTGLGVLFKDAPRTTPRRRRSTGAWVMLAWMFIGTMATASHFSAGNLGSQASAHSFSTPDARPGQPRSGTGTKKTPDPDAHDTAAAYCPARARTIGETRATSVPRQPAHRGGPPHYKAPLQSAPRQGEAAAFEYNRVPSPVTPKHQVEVWIAAPRNRTQAGPTREALRSSLPYRSTATPCTAVTIAAPPEKSAARFGRARCHILHQLPPATAYDSRLAIAGGEYEQGTVFLTTPVNGVYSPFAGPVRSHAIPQHRHCPGLTARMRTQDPAASTPNNPT